MRPGDAAPASHAGKPLQGILVVDLTQFLSGPFCTMILADLGARVIKIEPPGGDEQRRTLPRIDDYSVNFLSVNRNKESVALDLKTPEGHAFLMRLLRKADVLIENFRPGVMDRLNLSWEQLRERFPSLILASLSGFGQYGPYSARPAYDMIVQAMGGIMSLTGHPGQPPTRVGVSIGDLTAGLFMAIGIEAALLGREKTKEGTHIDVGMLDCQVAMLDAALARYQATGQVPTALGSRHPTSVPFDAFEASDGYIVITASSDRRFAELCALIGAPRLAADPRYATREARLENEPELKRDIEEKLGAGTVAQWMEKLQEHGVPCAPLNTVSDIYDDPHVAARDMLVDLRNEGRTVMKVAGNPIKFAPEKAGSFRFPPELNAHRKSIEEELEAQDYAGSWGTDRPGD